MNSFRFIIYCISILILISCNEKLNTDSYYQEILSLKTHKAKEDFLFEIFQDDQELRNLSSNVLLENNYNLNSPAYRQHVKKINLRDSINFEKVINYLKIHGYPDFIFESELASYAITAVAIHQTYTNKLEILPYLEGAYSDKSLSSKYFSSFLNRMHIDKFGNSLPVINPDSLYIEKLLTKIKIDIKD